MKSFFLFFKNDLFILFLHTRMFPACRFRLRTYMAQDWTLICINHCLITDEFSIGLDKKKKHVYFY